jgi:triacylglycerol esterase/lipase EstA (alpha/beta hydrolase family)
VVARYWAAELGGDAQARRVVSLASPQHGTDLAALASGLGSSSCPAACRQLAPDSDLLRALNTDDETPAGPRWVAIWTEDDATVVPPSSGALVGAQSYSGQSVCPGLEVAHGDAPRAPAFQEMVRLALTGAEPALPSRDVC